MIKKIKQRKKDFELGIIGVISSYFFEFFAKYILSPIVKFLWVRKIEGIHHIPKHGPVIIASNHESYFDFIIFYAISPRKIQYLAAEKFFTSKFWKPLMVATGQIKVERVEGDKTNVHEKAHYVLKNEGMLGIFPEGTRSRTGEIGKAFTGVTRFALETKTPIIPVGIEGAFDILPPHKKMPNLKKCNIKISEPIYHHEHFEKEHTEELLTKLTDDLMKLIAFLVGKEYKHHYSLQEKHQEAIDIKA
ncbi:MAG: lysophospholipid acyltransferase family protein [Patescibacteria group bacterium]|jgi:1-acyl-sn-glycerol-3-phosphate acyltransferase|nr:lysophospholipid acyltransferase family protein [Patescibacteria group bacterium]